MFPRGVLIYLTDKCNLHCKHCGIVERYSGIYLDRKSFNRTIKLLHESKCYIVALSGGDPILHPNLYDYIKTIRQHGMLPVLGLSGVGLTDDDVLRLKNSKLGCVQVSLDGKDEITNSVFRDKGVFAEVIKNVEKMANNGILVNIATCISRENIDFYREILELFSKMKIYHIKVQNWKENKNKKQLFTPLNEEDKRKVLGITKDFLKDHNYKNRIFLDNEFYGDNKTDKNDDRFILFPNGDVGNLDDYGENIIGNINSDFEKIRRFYNE